MVMSLFFYYSFLCFVLLISECFSSSFDHHHLCSPTEASALIKFKQSFQNMSEEYYRDWSDGDCSPKTKSWNESRDCCSWDGVTCDLLNGHVIGLDLSCSQIVVTFHPNSTLFQLHHLHTLNLAYNHFNYSSIPHNIGRLANLRHLNLSDAWFQGKIPTEISYLSNLVSLDLSYSYGLQLDERTFVTMLHNLTNLELLSLSEVNISSPIPLNISSSLRYLDLDNTNLRGVLTESFFHLPNSLETLKLSSNDLLKGVFPKIHRRNTLLMELDISDTGISGELPDSVGTFSSLNILNLQRCHFSGSIPDSIGNLTQITELDFSHNNFTGHIPSTISKLKHLTGLHLSSNSFSDLSRNNISNSIPSCLGSMANLTVLDLRKNNFTEVFGIFKAMIKLDNEDTGEIKYMRLSDTSYEDSVTLVIKGQDIELQRISTIMTTIDLSSNHFEGVIPKTLKDLSSLWLLNLSHNNIRGDIPMELGQLNTLEALDLSWNRLTGMIPQELTRMNFLAFLNLSQNHLIGPIPHGLQFNTFGNDSYGSNLDLCGPPLSKQCGTSDSSHLPQPLEEEEDESESYFFSGFTWESVVIGYSFGLVVGTVMWSLMFKYRKPKWFVEFF